MLTIIVAGPDAHRFNAALTLATASAAVGDDVALFLHAEAVALLGADEDVDDARQRDAGLPTNAELLAESMAMGAIVTACQSGLALHAMRADRLPEGVACGGLVELLGARRESRLAVY